MLNENTRQAFEVEDIQLRTNTSIVYDPTEQTVTLVDTSRYSGNIPIAVLPNNTNKEHTSTVFPFNTTSAYEYYKYLREKASAPSTICFIGYVDPDTFLPVTYEE